MNKNLLVDSTIDAVRQRLVITLENIKFQKNVVFLDDIEKIEHCIKALENIEKDLLLAFKLLKTK